MPRKTDYICLARLARLSIYWPRVISSQTVMKVCRNFKEGLDFIAENQIFLLNSLSQILIVISFFIDQSNLYKWIKCLLIAFDFIAN